MAISEQMQVLRDALLGRLTEGNAELHSLPTTR
jgi:hypothetical protein